MQYTYVRVMYIHGIHITWHIQGDVYACMWELLEQCGEFNKDDGIIVRLQPHLPTLYRTCKKGFGDLKHGITGVLCGTCPGKCYQ